MGWSYLAIFFVISLLICLCGFKKYVYFLSVGYGLSVAGIGLALAIMSIAGVFNAGVAHYLLFLLLIVYGVRLGGFLLIREFRSAGYKKNVKQYFDPANDIPMFVKISIWLCVAVLYVAQTAPVSFRLFNGGESSALVWIGIVICIAAIILESASDAQKSAQKKVRPDMVAMDGLYKIVRCPNYLGEILFWTGITVSSLDTLQGAGQWITAIVAYICIVFIMFNGAQRLEKRQMARYGNNAEYKAYTDKTPIIIPFIPLYHLNKQA